MSVNVGLPTKREGGAQTTNGVRLVQREEGLTLVGEGVELCPDFSRMLPRLQPNRLAKELLVRAAKLRDVSGTPLAIDATAGLGEDALLLAGAGYAVRMYERDTAIAALLRDALDRAALIPELAGLVDRMELVVGDSVRGMREADVRPDIVLLDPMFPQRKKSAAVKKKLRLLQALEQPCEDEAELVAAAVSICPRKVIVKRPAKGPTLAGMRPNYTLKGKAIRYDVLLPLA